MLTAYSLQVRTVRVVWLMLVVAAVSLYILRQIGGGPYGKDFTMFLTGAHILAQGQGANLYNLSTQDTVQAPLSGGVEFGAGVLPFNYPPYIAALFTPLTLLSPVEAYYLWVGIQWLVLLGLIVSIWRYQRAWYRSKQDTVVMTTLSFVPIFEALLMGQMSLVLLALWWWMFVSWRKGKWGQLGVAVALAAFKPQLILLPIAGLAAEKRWRALAYAAFTQAALWGTIMLFTGPSILWGYIDILRLSASLIDTLGFFGEIMPSVRGLLVTIGVSPQLSMQIAMLFWIVSIGAAFWLWRRPWSFVGKFGIMVVLAVLCSPHIYPHDASLLILGVVCVSFAYIERSIALNTRWLLASLAAIFVGMYLIVFRISLTWATLILPMWLFACIVLGNLVWIVVKRRVAARIDLPSATPSDKLIC